jgi:hypothetical protein
MLEPITKKLYKLVVEGQTGILFEGSPEGWVPVDVKKLGERADVANIRYWAREQVEKNDGVLVPEGLKIRFTGDVL